LLINQPGKRSWPITGATYILMHEQQSDAAKAKAVLQFFDWAYREGGPTAEKLDYIPMPEKVVGMIEDMWTKRIRAGGEPVWTRK
jgi:phosphate transport system substrate-binding protein